MGSILSVVNRLAHTLWAEALSPLLGLVEADALFCFEDWEAAVGWGVLGVAGHFAVSMAAASVVSFREFAHPG